MEDSRAEFDAHDAKLLDEAKRETEAAEAAASTDAVEEVAEPQTPQTPEQPAAGTPEAAPTPAAPVLPPADAGGSAKAALRAARHEAKRLREENEALRKRIEAGGDAQAPNTQPDETQLNDVREYAPEVGRHLDALKAENEALRKRASPAPQPEFVPDAMPEDVQAGIDEVPELLQWQNTEADQDKWEAAKAADTLLMRSPRWQNKSFAERFTAAVALVKSELATPSKVSTPKRTLEDAQRAIAAATSAPAGAVTLGDLRGGAPPASHSIPDYQAQLRAGMSDETLIASLPHLP